MISFRYSQYTGEPQSRNLRLVVTIKQGYILLSWMNTLRLYLNTQVFCLLAASCGALSAAALSGPEAFVENYRVASAQQEQAFHGSSMEVNIEASLPKLKKSGRLHGLRRISRLGRITYEALHFEGDNSVKHHVIARYLAAEAEAQAEGAPSLAVTPDNYKFKYKGSKQSGGQNVEVFLVSPRHKLPGLFNGEIWIDAKTFLCVRQSGRLVKSPSIFIKKIEFVKDFGIQDGVSVPRQIHSVVETRLVGQAELTIDFQNVSLTAEPQIPSPVDVGDQ